MCSQRLSGFLKWCFKWALVESEQVSLILMDVQGFLCGPKGVSGVALAFSVVEEVPDVFKGVYQGVYSDFKHH